MANICDYEMKVVGKQESVEKFINIMQAEYECKETDPKHLWRVSSANVDNTKNVTNGNVAAMISGDCAWSVYSCMMNEKNTYQANDTTGCGTTLDTESKRLNIDIEVISEEPGVGFMEHFLIKQGKIIINDCKDYEEYYTDDYQNVAQLNKKRNTNFSEEQFEDSDGCLTTGGIKWKYTI